MRKRVRAPRSEWSMFVALHNQTKDLSWKVTLPQQR